MNIESKDIRDAFFDQILQQANDDSRVIVITNDMDVFSLRRFKQDHPDRFINVGVAEQNMINVAAGLASCGKIPIVYGISSFVTFRCYEQLRFNVCSMKLPVIVVGIGSGLSFSFDGPTHHGTQDFAVMRSLPEMGIYNPGDIVSAAACARQALESKGPVFVRIDKGPFPSLYDRAESFEDGFGVLRPLSMLNIVSTGYMTPRAVRVVDSLAQNGINVGLVDVFRLKPLSHQFVTRVLGNSQRMITVEENALIGGLGSLVSETISDHGLPVRLLRLGAVDEQVLRYGSRDWMLAGYGLDEDSLSRRIRDFGIGN